MKMLLNNTCFDTLLRSHHAFHASVFLNNCKYIKKFNIRLTSYEWLNDFFTFLFILCLALLFYWNGKKQFIMIFIIIIIFIIILMATFTIWSEVKWKIAKKGTSNINMNKFKGWGLIFIYWNLNHYLYLI